MNKHIVTKENNTEQQKVSTTLIAVNATLAVCLFSFIVMIYQSSNEKHIVAKAPEVHNIVAFNTIATDARAIYIWDASDNKVIYAKDETTALPLASLTKLMTMDTALSLVPANIPVTINPTFLAQEGDSGLYAGETWSLKNLINFSLVVSSNDGAQAIASVAGAFSQNTQNTSIAPDYTIGLSDFIADMNQKAQTLGLTTLHFKNPTGLDPTDGGDGGVGSASDVAHLMYYTIKTYPVILEDTKDSSVTISSQQYAHNAVNTDVAIPTIPGLIASKTGYTNRAGGNLVVAFDAGLGRVIIISVLGSTYDGRFTDMSALASSTVAYIQDNNI